MESSSRKCCFAFEVLPSRTRCGIVFSKPRQNPTWRCAGWAMYAISLPLSCIWKICPSALTYSLKVHLGAICCCNSQSCTVKQLRSETAAEATDRSAPCCGPPYYFSARRYARNGTIPPPRAVGFNLAALESAPSSPPARSDRNVPPRGSVAPRMWCDKGTVRQFKYLFTMKMAQTLPRQRPVHMSYGPAEIDRYNCMHMLTCSLGLI